MANSTSQLFRTMNCLVDSGYVIKDEIHGKYSLTLKLFELANRHSPLKHLLRVAILPMQELARTIRESCHISIIQHRQLLVVGQAESPEKVQISPYQSARPSRSYRPFPGACCLAAMDEKGRNAILEEDGITGRCQPGNASCSGNASRKSKRSGISSAVDESFIGLQDTAVLVGNPAVGVTAAIAITQLTASRQCRDPQAVTDALLSCARQINQRAGLTEGAGQQLSPVY